MSSWPSPSAGSWRSSIVPADGGPGEHELLAVGRRLHGLVAVAVQIHVPGWELPGVKCLLNLVTEKEAAETTE
jgi:hypothetical protein